MKCRLLTPLLALSFSLAAIAQDVPKADLFLGYSFLRFNSATEIPAFSANGGLGTFGLNFNNHIGAELELGAYHNGNIHNYYLDTTSVSFLAGPRISLGRSKKIDPYFHVLFGGMDASTSISAVNLVRTTLPNVPATDRPTTLPAGTTLAAGTTVTVPNNLRYGTSQVNFAMAAGGGVDIKVSRRVTFRPIQLDYVLTRFQSLGFLDIPSQNRNQNNLRYAAGFMFNIGGEHAEPAPAMRQCPDGTSVPVTQDCPKQNMSFSVSASPSEVCPGAVVSVAPPAGIPAGASFDWQVNGEPAGQSGAFQFATANRAPGSYKITLKVTAAGYNDGSSDTTVRVLAYQPPTGSVSASPSEVWVGERATLGPNFTAGQCGGPLHPAACTVSQGSINGNQYDSTGVQFDPNDNAEQRKNVTIACNVSDDKGSGSAETSVIVKKKGAIVAKRLPDVLFPKNSARVNNCGKRVLLEDLKTYEDSDPTANVVFVGHQADNESQVGLDLKRAMNVAAVISAGKGVCTAFPASQVLVSAVGSDQKGVDFQPHFCGSSMGGSERPGQGVAESDDAAKYRRVEVWFVPTNGTLPPSLAKEYKDAATLAVVGLGCPQ